MQPVGAQPPAGYTWSLVFTDEFDTLDTSTWFRYHNTYGSGVNAQDYLTAKNITVANSVMTVTSKRQTYTGPDGSREFTSGFLSTGKRGAVASPAPSADRFFPRAGYIEARLRIPQYHGILPAFWLRHRAGAGVAEVDILEVFQDQLPDRCTQTLHLNGVSNVYKARPVLQDQYTAPAWHVLGVAIHPDTGGVRFRFYLDGAETGTFLATDTRFFDDYTDADLWDVSLNIHTGSTWTGHPDDPLGYSRFLDRCLSSGTPGADHTGCDQTGIVAPSFPVTFDADYVRAYSLQEVPVTVLREHHLNGTAGSAVDAAAEGYDNHLGETISYVSGGISGGSSAQCPGTGYGYLVDSLDAAFVRVYFQVPSAVPTTTAVVLVATDSGGSVIGEVLCRKTSGKLTLTDGSTYGSTSSFTITPGAWVRLEWNVDTTAGSSELRIFADPASTTPTETITQALSSTATIAQQRIGQGSASNSPYLIDEHALGSGWIGPAGPEQHSGAGSPLVVTLSLGQGSGTASTPPAGVGLVGTAWASGNGATTVSVPSGTADGDVLLAYATCDTDGSASSLAAPSGWTQVLSVGASGVWREVVWYRVASSEPSSYEFTLPAASSSASQVRIAAFTGCDASNPVSAHATKHGSTSSATVPSLTPGSGIGAVVVGYSAGNQSGAGMSTPSGLSLIGQAQETNDGWDTLGMFWADYTSSSATPAYKTTLAIAYDWSSFVLALNGTSSTQETYSGSGEPLLVVVSLGDGTGQASEPSQPPETVPVRDLPNRSAPLRLRYDLTVYETTTGRIVESLDYSDLSFNTPLDDTGQASATIPLTGRHNGSLDIRSLTTPWRFALLISAGDTVLWFGPITPGRSYDGGDSVTLPASELWCVLKARPLIGNPATVGKSGELPTDLTLSAADLPSLAVKVVQRALSVPGGSLPMALPNAIDGDAHTRAYKGTDFTTAAEALGKLSDARGGPDIRFDARFVGGDHRYAQWRMRVG